MPEELELKYSIHDPAAVEAWLDAAFPPSLDHAWRTISITDRYFDSADGALSGAGYGARLRRTGRRTTLTLKSDIKVDGALHQRLELEGPASQKLDAGAWRPSEARERLLELADGKRLVELFVVRQRRHERLLRVGGADVLASVDNGAVMAAGADAGAISQFELEYRAGRPLGLERLAHAVDESGLGRPEPRSKLALALDMVAAANKLGPSDLYTEAGRKVLRRHLLRMLDREVDARAGETLAQKQMRVATRRLRATWRVFADGFKRSTERQFANESRRVGRALGAVRDVEVLLEGLPDDAALEPFVTHLGTRRAEAFAGLSRLLAGKRYQRFVEEMLDFTATPAAGAARRAATATVQSTAPVALAEALERVRVAGSLAIDDDDAVAWHALRIEARRFRYSVEAFADVLDKRAARELIERVTRVQDHLGAMNDAAVAIEEASLWIAENEADADGPTHTALARYIARREAEIVALRRGFGGPWRSISGVTFDRRLERALQGMVSAPLTNS